MLLKNALRLAPGSSKISILAILMVFLSACASNTRPPEIITLDAPEIPAELLTCPPQPMPPLEDHPEDVGKFIVELVFAHSECRTNLHLVRDYLTEENKSNPE